MIFAVGLVSAFLLQAELTNTAPASATITTTTTASTTSRASWNQTTTGECDCATHPMISGVSLGSDPCCYRNIYACHKHGFLLIHDTLDHGYLPKVKPVRIATNAAWGKETALAERYTHRAADYRSIMVVRNWYDAIISGYLYHKRGHECTVGLQGNRFAAGGSSGRKVMGWLYHNPKWFQYVRVARGQRQQQRPQPAAAVGTTATATVFPEKQDEKEEDRRDLCSYLAEESEFYGLLAYADWALNMYQRMQWMLALKHQERNREDGKTKTLVVCYEDFVANYTSVVQEMQSFLYPASGDDRTDRPVTIQPPTSHDGHKTSHDRKLRQRLKQYLLRMDEVYFGGDIAAGNSHFNCGRPEASSLSVQARRATPKIGKFTHFDQVLSKLDHYESPYDFE